LDYRAQLDIPTLNSLALRSLVELFNQKEQLFCERATFGANGYCRDGVSQKQTIVALLGLRQLALSERAEPLDIPLIRDAVIRDRRWVTGAEDLGLLTWFIATYSPGQMEAIVRELDFDNGFEAYEDVRRRRTTGLAWFLAGVAHAALARPEFVSQLTDVAVDAYRLLESNQGNSGLFGSAGSAEFTRETLHKRFGTLRDQVSAIYALSTFARAFQIEEPLESALACANSICALQGDLGQWWFLYDKSTGRVAKRYPVISSHQDGIAPSALLALEKATGRSFDKAILRGLSWITGANEVGVDLRGAGQNLIWESIDFQGRISGYWDAALSSVNGSRHAQTGRLKIRYEVRPDHFGWLLYAFGGLGLAAGRSLAAHA
jgi:hypothetical protein